GRKTYAILHSYSGIRGFLTKFVEMRNLIIITSFVFIAVVVTSYMYFSNLGNKGEPLGLDEVEVVEADQMQKTEETTETTVPLWTFDLNAASARKPSVFSLEDGHRIILIEDAYHILYAISENGEKLWNAQLPGPIVGNILQVDGSNLLFSTTERLYYIDSTGDPLPGFSLKLPRKATDEGVTVSYENNGKARIDVKAGNRILSFDDRGRHLGTQMFRSVHVSSTQDSSSDIG